MFVRGNFVSGTCICRSRKNRKNRRNLAGSSLLPNGRTILSMLTVTLWTEKWRIDLQKTHLNRYDRKSIEIVIGLGALWNWIDIACKCPFLHQSLNLYCATNNTSMTQPSFRVDSNDSFCSDLLVKRCAGSAGDRDWLSQLLLLF